MIISQQQFKSSADGFNESFFDAEHFSEEIIAKN